MESSTIYAIDFFGRLKLYCFGTVPETIEYADTIMKKLIVDINRPSIQIVNGNKIVAEQKWEKSGDWYFPKEWEGK